MKTVHRIWEWFSTKNLRFEREHRVVAIVFATVFLAWALVCSMGYSREQWGLPLWIFGGGLVLRIILANLPRGHQNFDGLEKKHKDSQCDQ